MLIGGTPTIYRILIVLINSLLPSRTQAARAGKMGFEER
jgi:hypothetical protein